jgi:hypothetical protein
LPHSSALWKGIKFLRKKGEKNWEEKILNENVGLEKVVQVMNEWKAAATLNGKLTLARTRWKLCVKIREKKTEKKCEKNCLKGRKKLGQMRMNRFPELSFTHTHSLSLFICNCISVCVVVSNVCTILWRKNFIDEKVGQLMLLMYFFMYFEIGEWTSTHKCVC